jgi:hypothetical protein
MFKKGKSMSGTAITKIRKTEPPAVFKTKNGNERLTGGRWHKMRVAEFLDKKKTWQSMDDLARFVYGSVTVTYRENSRKHIPSQRRYMLDQDTPIVTEYGPRGVIVRVKIYDQNNDDDKVKFQTEISKARDKKEISERRYDQLVSLFLIGDDTQS